MTREVHIKDYRLPDGSTVEHASSYAPDSVSMEDRIRHAVELVNDNRASRICCPGQWRVERCQTTGTVVIERPLPKARRIRHMVRAARHAGSNLAIGGKPGETL